MVFLPFYVSTGQPHRSLIALERRLSCSVCHQQRRPEIAQGHRMDRRSACADMPV